MARLKKKGNAGAAKAYITRTQAIKKLQCSLADFRRLCILKGIFPREPRHRKRANKGSSAPTSFYYTKDIAYLQHEPVLTRLREHKAFAKKLSRAIGRTEWSTAKSLEGNKPVYTLDHIIKERYPTFIDALRDIDDALCLIFLFASLPINDRVPQSLVENCARLTHEWQLYVMHTKALRKVFLSIKGIYYQAEVQGEKITWLVPYQFSQTIPSDVDVRVMLTFLELYQTLLGFVFFKIYTDEGWSYPPPLDLTKAEGAAGVGALSLQPARPPVGGPSNTQTSTISGKNVRLAIQEVQASSSSATSAQASSQHPQEPIAQDEDFVMQPSTSITNDESAQLSTFKTIENLSSPNGLEHLFSSLTFYLSRETPRSLMEFIVRACGGRVGWPSSSGSGSPFEENEESITHVIIDRPILPGQSVDVIRIVDPLAEQMSEEQRRIRRRRKYVQPQWVVDCINACRLLGEEAYERGKILPPHLSPFGEAKGAYDPASAELGKVGVLDDALLGSEEEAESDSGDEEPSTMASPSHVLKEVAHSAKTDDAFASRGAELAAEVAGIEYDAFQKAAKKGAAKKSATAKPQENEQEMNKMLMSNKQRKLYEKMKFSQRQKSEEKLALERKSQALVKGRRKAAAS